VIPGDDLDLARLQFARAAAMVSSEVRVWCQKFLSGASPSAHPSLGERAGQLLALLAPRGVRLDADGVAAHDDVASPTSDATLGDADEGEMMSDDDTMSLTTQKKGA
jgi:hypothetical protein